MNEKPIIAKEYKVVALRECPLSADAAIMDVPEKAAAYWAQHVRSHPYFNPEVECLVVLLLNTRRKIKGHVLVSLGIADTLLSHPREVFRAAIVASASAVVVMHNHPSGEPEPSEADIKVTRDLARAGQLLKIEMLDHVVVSSDGGTFKSLRQLGYLAL
jgi:DNA repair protein RadC